MAKQESVDFQELFGASTVRESLDAAAPVVYRKPEPALPTDSPMWEFTPASPTGTPNTVQDSSSFFEVLFGHCFSSPAVAPATSTPDLGKKILADAGRYFRRTQELDKKEPRRKRELGAIIDRWARECGLPQSVQPELDRVKESAAKCLRGILMEVTA